MRANSVYVGIKGTVLALERNSGRILWQRNLAGSSFVNLVESGQQLFALSQGEAYCLDAETGAILWHNPLKGLGLGIGSIQVSGHPSAAAPAAAIHAAAEEQSAVASTPAAI